MQVPCNIYKHILFLQLIFSCFAVKAQIPDDSLNRGNLLLQKKLLNEPHFFISGAYGFGYRLAGLPKDLNQIEKEYYKDLKTGTFYQFDAAFFLKNGFGFGLLYNAMNADASIDNVTVLLNNGVTKTGTVADDITISYYALQCYYRYWQEYHTGFFSGNFGIGYMNYTDNGIVIDPYKRYGGTAGLNISFSYFIALSPEIWIGPHLSYMAGFLSKYTVDDGQTKQTYTLKEDEMESLHHVDISIKAAITF
jgi:hypothetical protein